jgi:hypothetical protein
MEILKQPPTGTMQIGVVYPQTELRGDPSGSERGPPDRQGGRGPGL